MKIKSDFVTNSSSTSFIVAFPEKVTSKEMLSRFIKRQDFQEVIWNDIKEQTAQKASSTSKALVASIAQDIDRGYYPKFDAIDYDKTFCIDHGITRDQLRNNQQWRDQCYKEADKLKTEFSFNEATKFLTENDGSYIYTFQYGNEIDEGVITEIEYENDWGNLPHLSISHH